MTEAGAQSREVATHYERAGLVDRLAVALDARFRDGRCEPDDLAELDQFHLGGIVATAALGTSARSV